MPLRLKRQFLSFFLLLPFLASCFAFAGGSKLSSDPWIGKPPELADAKEVPEEDFYEVVPSRLGVALRDLESVAVKPLTCEEAAYFAGGAHFKCDAKKKPYLVRAVFENGGTGDYLLSQEGDLLVVSHGSLGKPTGPHHAALVVNSARKITKVICTVGGAL